MQHVTCMRRHGTQREFKKWLESTVMRRIFAIYDKNLGHFDNLSKCKQSFCIRFCHKLVSNIWKRVYDIRHSDVTFVVDVVVKTIEQKKKML